MSHPGGLSGQGDLRAEDMAVAKLPFAPVAHSVALTAAVRNEALLPAVKQIDQPAAQASAGLAHGTVPPQVTAGAPNRDGVLGLRNVGVPFHVAPHAATVGLLHNPSQVPSLHPPLPSLPDGAASKEGVAEGCMQPDSAAHATSAIPCDDSLT